MSPRRGDLAAPAADPAAAGPLAPALGRALAGMRYGPGALMVHDGRVVQIERRERLRIEIDRSTGDPHPLSTTDPPRRRRPDDRSASDLSLGEEK